MTNRCFLTTVVCAPLLILVSFGYFLITGSVSKDAVGVTSEGVGGVRDLGVGAILSGSVDQSGSRAIIPLELKGTLSIQDHSGGPFRLARNGHVSVDVDGHVKLVDLHFGEFRIPAHGGQSMRLVGATEDNVKLRVSPIELHSTDSMVEVVGFSYPGFFLEVQKVGGGRVENVVAAMDQFRNVNIGVPLHPGNTTRLVDLLSRSSEPYFLPLNLNDDQVLWVHARGMEWKAIDWKEVRDGGRIGVALGAGGDAVVDIEQLGMTSGLKLYVEPANGGFEYASYRGIKESRINMGGFPVGEYLCHLSYRLLPEKGAEVSDRVAFSITPNGVSPLVLRMLPSSFESPGFLSGSLKVDNYSLWEGSPEYASLRLTVNSVITNPEFEAISSDTKNIELKEMQATPGQPGSWFWEFGEIPNGEYELSISPLGYKEHVLVEGGDAVFHSIGMPEVAKVLLVFEDEHGKKLTGVAVGGIRDVHRGPSTRAVRAKSAQNEVSFLCMPGKRKLLFVKKGQPTIRVPFEFLPGWNYEVVKLAKVSLDSIIGLPSSMDRGK